MLKWFIRRRLAAFQRKFDYNLDYARDILDADTTAFLRFARLDGLSVYRRDVPLDVYYAVKLTSTVLEDCGPCTQLMVAMALHDGVTPRTIATVLEGTEALLDDATHLGVRFARAVAAHDPAADALRDDIVRRWARARWSRWRSRSPPREYFRRSSTPSATAWPASASSSPARPSCHRCPASRPPRSPPRPRPHDEPREAFAAHDPARAHAHAR